MAVFFIDYENVNAKDGLKGTEFLTGQDILILFYSNTCGTIRQNELEEILSSGCKFQTYKLKQTSKNGLDFYIASEAGAQARDGQTQLAIISNDKGFQAAVDFLEMKYQDVERFRILRATSIEIAISLLNDPADAKRRTAVLKSMKRVDIGQEYARYLEREAITKRIEEALLAADSSYSAQEVLSYAREQKGVPMKTLYTKTLHSYGRAAGTAIYRILKELKKGDETHEL
jgi:hypothetical protein